ncbi:armadillo-type protein [Mycena capillaripes]|nr:armadillo-type protein [Mycena capillaripes]
MSTESEYMSTTQRSTKGAKVDGQISADPSIPRWADFENASDRLNLINGIEKLKQICLDFLQLVLFGKYKGNFPKLEVLDFIDRNHGIPLSSTILDSCSSYLGYKYLTSATKILILKDLERRATSEEEACALADSVVLNDLNKLLESSDSDLRRWTDDNIDVAESAARAVSCIDHRQLSAFIHNNCDIPLSSSILGIYSSYLGYKYLTSATKILILEDLKSRATSEDEARTLADSAMLNKLIELLISPDADIRRWTCEVMGGLALHDSTTAAILGMACSRLVALLHDTNTEVLESAAHAPSHVTEWPARAVMDAKAVVPVADDNLDVVENAVYALSQLLVWVNITATRAARTPDSLAHFFDLYDTEVTHIVNRVTTLFALQITPVNILESATYALAQLMRRVNGVEAAAAANIHDHIPHLLASKNAPVRVWTCGILGRLACGMANPPTIPSADTCRQLMVDLSDDHPGVLQGALYALAQITTWPYYSAAALEAKALDHLPRLDSPEVLVQIWTCEMIGNLSSHASTVGLLNSDTYLKLVALSDEISILRSATFTPSRLTRWPIGAQAAANAKALEPVQKLLKFQDDEVQRSARRIMDRLESHPFTEP